MITKENPKRQITNNIKKYFHNLKVIQWQKTKVEKLYERLESIEKDRKSTDFSESFHTDLQAVRYDKVIVQGGQLPSSMMDREIELIYQKLDREYQSTQAEILDTNILIRKLEKENEKMEFCLNNLKEEYFKIVEQKFKYGKNIITIALEMNISKSSISRILNDVYNELMIQMEK